MKKRIPILLLVIAISGTTLYWFGLRDRKAQTISSLHGNVDIREVNLGFRVPGRIRQITPEEGDAVKSAQVIARLDPEPYQREVDEVRAQVKSLQARLEMLEAGYRPQEIQQAKAFVREREVTLENARRLAQRQEELRADNAISEQEFEDAEASYREAEARFNSACEQLALLESGYRAEEIAQAKADLAGAEAALAASQLRLQDTELKAPADGVILTRAQEPGAMVQIAQTVLTLSLQEPVWVRSYINEPNLGRIYPGMPVEVVTDTRPDKPYKGQIGYISPRAEFTPKNVETPDLRTSLVYRFRVVVENPDEGLRQGMPVTVRLPTADIEAAPSRP